MTFDELIAMLEMQEEILQFKHFTNEDAWALGNIIAAEARRRGLPVAVSIRLNNGYVVFQYAADGTNLQNENWMRRKYNSVKTLEHSTLHTYILLRKNEESLEDWSLDSKDYAAAGGGFPIRIEDTGVIGSILVSGMDQVSDHDLIIKCVSRYLHVDEVPRIKGEIL
ncbi:MAG TPA: heme-degrading domain-containing protein [Candidatus Limivivens intestinipullorum]|uniref:Heme-degrading domain-containing protein n=1 Tax=Candidatus Limivivens intestinipullorum TaxID=2840858 RepID=A0A9D1EUA2_9FIRM|nr:heme-degrading domain-containing protein [Candidatus Limivivens intestinipullorum]